MNATAVFYLVVGASVSVLVLLYLWTNRKRVRRGPTYGGSEGDPRWHDGFDHPV